MQIGRKNLKHTHWLSVPVRRDSGNDLGLPQTGGDTRRFELTVGGVILVAWGILAIWSASPYAALSEHGSMEASRLPLLPNLALLVVNWALMTTAMMLPGDLPLLHQLHQRIRHQANRNWSMAVFMMAYLATWTLFGLLVGLGQHVLHSVADSTLPTPSDEIAAFICRQIQPGADDPLSIPARNDISVAASLLLAGVYQFTPAKRARLRHCRSPHALLQACRSDEWSYRTFFLAGAQRGRACVGNCWALMLCMVALEMSLCWMLALGVIMAVERAPRWGQHFTPALGVVLVVGSVVSLVVR